MDRTVLPTDNPAEQALDEYTVRVTFRLAAVFIINNGLAGLIAQFVSIHDTHIRLRNMGVIGLALLVFFGVLLLVQTRIHSSYWQKTIYFTITFLSYVLAHLINGDKGLLVAMAMVGLIMPFLVVLFRIRYALEFGALHLVAILVHWFIRPTATVAFGPGTYLYLLLSALAMLYISYEGIRLFRRYEDKLRGLLRREEIRNAELGALNEEYQASEETLQAQYDEILTLHLGAEDLNEKLQTILRHAREGILDYNIATGQCLVSPNAQSLLGVREPGLYPMERGWLKMSKETLPQLVGEWRQVLTDNEDPVRRELHLPHHPDGTKVLQAVFCRFQARLDETDHLLTILQDVTQERQNLQHIHQLAYHDQLTGLLNRTGLEAAIDARIARTPNPFAVAVFDLRDFRSVNETLGYSAGNTILQRIAEGLPRMPGHFADQARLGGDDFGMVLTDPDRLEEFRTYLINHRTNFGSENAELYLGVSAGVSLYPDHGKTAVELIQNAEMAMMQSREKGPNELACYDLLISDGVRRRVLLSNALENAIERNELHLAYQPVVRSTDRALEGFEALLRWRSDRHGAIAPDEFIAIAEQKGLIHRIGQFVLDEACRFVKQLEAQQKTGYVSVNVSGMQLLQDSFSDNFLSTLSVHGIAPERIGVEVTETAVIDNLDGAVTHLRRLQAHGIRIFLDDFGTGYSSLSYLGRLPVDVLKVDKQFVYDGMTSLRGKGLLATMIDLARNLDISVIAEGVETQAQLQILRDLGCTLIQGYHIARPLTEKAALAWPEPL